MPCALSGFGHGGTPKEAHAEDHPSPACRRERQGQAVARRRSSDVRLTPNPDKDLATSPAALEGYLNFGAALAGGAFDAKFREQIALTVSQVICEYCLAAHVAFRTSARTRAKRQHAIRYARASDPEDEAGLVFAQAIVVNRGEDLTTRQEGPRRAASPTARSQSSWRTWRSTSSRTTTTMSHKRFSTSHVSSCPWAQRRGADDGARHSLSGSRALRGPGFSVH